MSSTTTLDSCRFSPEALKLIREAKLAGKKIGFVCGVFDLFHHGHVLMLKECKEHCDFLVIGLNIAENFSPIINPKKKKPLFNFNERKSILENSRYVDLVAGYSSEEELVELLQGSQADIRFLGEDYRGKPITGREFTKEIHYTDRSHGLSTSLYREKLLHLC